MHMDLSGWELHTGTPGTSPKFQRVSISGMDLVPAQHKLIITVGSQTAGLVGVVIWVQKLVN